MYEKVNRMDIFRLLGVNTKYVSENMISIVESCIEELSEISKPKSIYRKFEIENFKLVGTNFELVGNDIKRHLVGCHSSYLLGTTLGVEVDKLIKRYQYINLERAIVLDSCGSVCIENLCQILDDEIKSIEDSSYTTVRYSPGYGDFPITSQKSFAKVLELDRRIGVKINSLGIMIPRKSITAIIGVSDNLPQNILDRCKICKLSEDCIYIERMVERVRK